MSVPAVREFADTVRIAFRHRRDEKCVKQHATVHSVRDREETWTWERGKNRVEHEVVTRRRPPVVVGGKQYLTPVDVHHPNEIAWSIARSAVEHGRAICPQLDVARDLICPTWDLAEGVRDAVLRGVVVVGARGGVRVNRGGTVYVGGERRVEFETTCDPTCTVRRRRTDQLEGACVVAYTGHQAAKKHEGHPPTLHAEIRFYGTRGEVFSFIEGWYNPRRRHSALGYKSPNEFEMVAVEAAAVPSP